MNNVEQFKDAYNILLKECIERREKAGFTRSFVAELLSVDRRKIVDLEKGAVRVGLLLAYADLMDIETFFNFKKH